MLLDNVFELHIKVMLIDNVLKGIIESLRPNGVCSTLVHLLADGTKPLITWANVDSCQIDT